MATTQSGLGPFALYRPQSLADAVQSLSDARTPAIFYAGGTDIFARFREGLRPSSLICLGAIDTLRSVQLSNDALFLGAHVTHAEALARPEIQAVPGLAEAWSRIATVRIRQQGTLGGNLMARSPRYELPILFSALGAEAHMVGPKGKRTLPVETLWSADLTGTPLLVSVSIPLGSRPRLDYERRMRPTFTQAACLRDMPTQTGGQQIRFVMATEWRIPWIAEHPSTTTPQEIMARLPVDYADPAVGNSYLRKVGGVLLGRQIARLGQIDE